MKDNAKIAVIGAGLAGLTAAYRLSQQGKAVDVFEARNRVGGRVLTANMKNYLGEMSLVELGAQNITDGGEAKNFLDLCQELDLKIESRQIDLEGLIYFQGKYIDYQDHLANFLKQHPGLLDELDALASRSHTIAELIEKIFENDGALKSALSLRMTAYEGVPVTQQSIYHNLDTFKCMLEGGLAKSHEFYEHESHHIIFKNIQDGNVMLPIKMAAALGEHCHLQKVLKNIDKIKDRFQLTFQDGTVLTYDFVILAIPASTYDSIQLSANIAVHDRWEKMKSVSYGSTYKMIFPFNLSTMVTHRSIITEQLISFFTQNQSLVVFFASQKISNLDAEIKIVQAGYHLPETVDIPPMQAAQDLNYVCYSHPIMHAWGTDVYAKGSYSGYSTILSEELDRYTDFHSETFKELFKPTSDGLFFIGEHTTISEYVGTMEAAVESGERIAKVFL